MKNPDVFESRTKGSGWGPEVRRLPMSTGTVAVLIVVAVIVIALAR
jgi:hypothetical protein